MQQSGDQPQRLDDNATPLATGDGASSLAVVTTSPAPESILRNHFSRWWAVWVAWLCSRIGVVVVGMLSQRAASSKDIPHLNFLELGVYVHYVDVLQNGYTKTNATEFPLLPMAMWAINSLHIPLAIGTFVFVNIAALIGLLAVAKLGERFVEYPAAVRAAVYMAIFPTAWAFSMASTEGVLLACMGGAALLALRGTAWGWGGALGLAMLCGLTRPPGVLAAGILLGIAIAQWRGGSLKGMWRRFLAMGAVAAAPAGAFAFFVYLHFRTGNFFASVDAQAAVFDRHMSLLGPLHAFTSAITSLRDGVTGPAFELTAALIAGACVVWFFLKAVGNRWEITGWTAFALGSLLLPLSTGTVWQMPRFALVIPPLFWMLGRAGKKEWFHNGALVLFPMALAFMLVFQIVGVVR